MSSTNQDASLLSGHATYAKGAVEETIGNVTGAAAWKASGRQDQEAGKQEMRVANENRPEAEGSGIGGRVEEVAGIVVGCEGMSVEGKEKQEQKRNIA
ncbi:hypothetical protein B0O99DRAFT_180228 [Bisporella sp. PMI_857]|nr:hypothetical protein B0O99DRAFT_180228 [Bisporella sp. PMI_857]